MKLRTLLLSVFLCAIILSSTAIIAFNYEKYSKSIANFSRETINRAGSQIVSRINCLLQDFERLPGMGLSFFQKHPHISVENTALTSFFLDAVKYFPDLFTYFIGTPDGSYLIAVNLVFFHSEDLWKTLPPDAAYVILFRNASDPQKQQTRAYYDDQFKLVGTEKIQNEDYDPRTRPWYIEAKKRENQYWSDIYLFNFPRIESGFSVSMPIYDASGLSSIIGAALSTELFSKFLTEQTIGKTGKAFIIDEDGKILLPSTRDASFPLEAVQAAFLQYKIEKAANFSFEFSHVNYLASMRSFPESFQKKWMIAIIAPSSDFFADFYATQREVILLSLAALAVASLFIIWISIRISRPIVAASHEIDRMTQLDLKSEMKLESNIEEIARIDSSISSLRTSLRSFGHYVPQEIAKDLMQEQHEITLGGEKKSITIFFTDIADFTSIAETLPVETLNTLLTDHFALVSEIILRCGGAIDKFIGDSIMSLWGAPHEISDQAARACTAALLCQAALSILNEKQKSQGMPQFVTRMGINTGVAIVGNFGTPERMNYSVIGDAVNTASRLQTINKNYKTKIIIGEETLHQIDTAQFLVRPLDIVEVRGKKQKVKIYELVAKRGDDPSIVPDLGQVELCEVFTEAFETLQRGDVSKGRELFQKIHEKFPEDYPTELYLKDRLGQA